MERKVTSETPVGTIVKRLINNDASKQGIVGGKLYKISIITDDGMFVSTLDGERINYRCALEYFTIVDNFKKTYADFKWELE
jgi:hypothetical protein